MNRGRLNPALLFQLCGGAARWPPRVQHTLHPALHLVCAPQHPGCARAALGWPTSCPPQVHLSTSVYLQPCPTNRALFTMLRWLSVAALGKPVVPAQWAPGGARATKLMRLRLWGPACTAGRPPQPPYPASHRQSSELETGRLRWLRLSSTHRMSIGNKSATAQDQPRNAPLVNWMLAGSPGRSSACRRRSSPASRPPSPIHRKSCQSSQPVHKQARRPHSRMLRLESTGTAD